jgi:hypothetical protein
MSLFVLGAGLWLALVADASGGIRLFGWVLVLIGLAGVAARPLLARRRSPP